MKDQGQVTTYLFGAICPDRAVGAAMIIPNCDTWGMNLHLQEISTQVACGAHTLLVCDGAGWHQRGKKLIVPDNLTLLSLPAYSPELNPMENVWDYLRQNKLSAQVWDDHEEITKACVNASDSWSTIQTASAQSDTDNRRVSVFRWVGIISRWRCGPVEEPEVPTAPIVSFSKTRAPTTIPGATALRCE